MYNDKSNLFINQLEDVCVVLLIFTSFAAGLVSFFSPCVIPLIPGFLAFLTGETVVKQDKGLNWNAFYKSLSFVAGFSLIFVLMGLSASTVGRFLIDYQASINIIGGAIIILFGLHMLGLLELSFLLRGGMKAPKLSNGFLLGIAFSIAWTPCVGPFLASILIIAGSEASISQGAILLSFYSLGLGIPFLLAALFWGKIIGFATNLAKFSWYLNKIAGAILVLLGILIMTGKFTQLAAYLA